MLFFVLRPVDAAKPDADNHSQLKKAIENYGDSIFSNGERNTESGERTERAYHRVNPETENGQRSGFHLSHNYDKPEHRRPTVELNTADTAELHLLYGIGPAFAGRIVRYRQRLGGFVRKEQLLEVYGMDTARYEGFADNVSIDSSRVTKLDINNATVEELRQHPYLDYYQARSLVNYRKCGNRLENMDDLLMVNLIDEETVRKLQGYIQFN